MKIYVLILALCYFLNSCAKMTFYDDRYIPEFRERDASQWNSISECNRDSLQLANISLEKDGRAWDLFSAIAAMTPAFLGIFEKLEWSNAKVSFTCAAYKKDDVKQLDLNPYAFSELKITDKVCVSLAQKLLASYKGENGKKVAILPVEGVNKTSNNGKVLYVNLFNEFFKDGRFQLIERGRVDKILKEQAFQNSGVVNMEQAVKVGGLAGVDLIVFTSFGETAIDVNLVEVSTGIIKGYAKVNVND